uniref:FIP-RBD domain-containing protein n=1 Tax=Periophthalmus magnuspinnatus TaxID=409849 RepID=A0A3B3ZML8_9GOBI
MEGQQQQHHDQEQLLQVLRRLKEVFDMCDRDTDGFIRVEHLVNLGLQFGQGDEVRRFLDPNAHGKINFRDFCHGVFAIKGCEEILKMPVTARSRSSSQASVTDNGYIYQVPHPFNYNFQLLRRQFNIIGCLLKTHNYGCLLLLTLIFVCFRLDYSSTSASASVLSGEEQFEDYGEGEDVEFSPSSPCPEEDSPQTHGFSDMGSSPPSSGGETPQKMRQLCNSELLDIYCSQCCKKVNLLNDLAARLRNLKSNSPRKISSRAFGRQLIQANHSVFGSSPHSSTEDLFTDSIDSCDLDIADKVSYLEKKVTELEGDCLANGDLKSKLKQENTHLVLRVHELEEQVKDAENRADQSLEDESKRHREVYSKMKRDRNHEIELLCSRIQELEEENGDMKLNVRKLRSQTEKLDQEKQRMSDKLEDTSLRLKDEMDLYRKIMDKLWHNRHEFQKEKEAMQELIDDLRRELEHLQLFKLEVEHPGQGKSLCELNARTREIEMEHEVKRLKQENYKLRDQNDDLNAQILSLSLYEARNLFSCHSKAQSLAAEIDSASRDELVDALKHQEEINLRLRQYMDKIILAILEHNPSILEIKT